VKARLSVIVPIEVEIPDVPGLDGAKIANALQQRLLGWRDGRYPYPTEQVEEGLSSALDWALRTAIERAFDALHGDRMIGRKSVARWEMERLLAKLDSWHRRVLVNTTWGGITVEATNVEPDNEGGSM